MVTFWATPPDILESRDESSISQADAYLPCTPDGSAYSSQYLVTGQTYRRPTFGALSRQQDSSRQQISLVFSKRRRLAGSIGDAPAVLRAITAETVVAFPARESIHHLLGASSQPNNIAYHSDVPETHWSTSCCGPDAETSSTVCRGQQLCPTLINNLTKPWAQDGSSELGKCGMGPHQATLPVKHAASTPAESANPCALAVLQHHQDKKQPQLSFLHHQSGPRHVNPYQQQPCQQPQHELLQHRQPFQAPHHPAAIPFTLAPGWADNQQLYDRQSAAGLQLADSSWGSSSALAWPSHQPTASPSPQPLWTSHLAPTAKRPRPCSSLSSQPPQLLRTTVPQEPSLYLPSVPQHHQQQQQSPLRPHHHQQQQQTSWLLFAPTTPPRCLDHPAPAACCPQDYILQLSHAFHMRPETTARLALHIWNRVQPMVQLVISVRHESFFTRHHQQQQELLLLPTGPIAQPAAAAVKARALLSEQIYAVAALWLAAKLEERRRELPSSRLLAGAARTLPGVLAAAELRVLQWCEWAPYWGFVPDESHLLVDL
ncbi:hypothetical protein Agub_g8741 [Astrephomene gubernaculifera]|uniref:Uncharacterized protein n=1 Tax=Astrephomene gubernaculifera TaxID=47775 RepID=A0AAD3DWG9_9CHLO|nr:hypothetical protein Agub_g8741 [Astrephomene gubernaculifera]